MYPPADFRRYLLETLCGIIIECANAGNCLEVCWEWMGGKQWRAHSAAACVVLERAFLSPTKRLSPPVRVTVDTFLPGPVEVDVCEMRA